MGIESKGITIVYDGECPVCRNYCKYLKIKKAVGEVKLVDARKPSKIMTEITALGLDIDEGMVVKLDNEIYYGDQAVNILGILGTKNDWFNKVNYWVFRSKIASAILYPLCKGVRNIILRLYGIKKIENIKK